MSKKQKAVAFDFFSYAIIFSAAFAVWVMVQSLTLVSPATVEASSNETIGRSFYLAREDTQAQQEVSALVNKQKLLQSTIDKFASDQNGVYSIHVESLEDGINAAHNSETKLWSASLYKLFAVQMALAKVDAGEWSLNQIMVDSDTLADCIEKVIIVSDNPCGVAIIQKLGHNQVKASVLKELGYPNTDISGVYTKTSASDVAKLLRDLHSGDLLSESSSQLFSDLLAAQKINDRLPQGLPSGVQIMHKTGDLEGYVHDAGIVRLINGSSYIIVVLSGPDPSIPTYQERYDKFAQLSKNVYEIMLN